MRHFESCDNSEENRSCPEKRTTMLMYMKLEMTECMTLWKCSGNGKTLSAWGKDTIAPDRFNAGYDEGYKEWLKKDIQNISFLILRSFRSVTDREAKAVAELQEMKEETNEVYAKFVENQDALERTTREVERLRQGYDEFKNWI